MNKMAMKGRVLKRTSNYELIEFGYNGKPIVFRVWSDGLIEVKADKNFARANGFNSMRELLDEAIGVMELERLTGKRTVDWITVNDNGEFVITSPAKLKLN